MEGYFKDKGESMEDYSFSVGYGYDMDEGRAFYDRAAEKIHASAADKDISFIQIGATIAVHTGPHAIGIGIIKLSPYSDDTAVLFPARKNELDYYTIDKLCRINPDFKSFITKVTKVLNAQAEVLEDVKGGLQKFCDKGFSSQEEILAYCDENHIPC